MKFLILVLLMAGTANSAEVLQRESLNKLNTLVSEINSKLPDNYCAPSKVVKLAVGEVSEEKLSSLLDEEIIEKLARVTRSYEIEAAVMSTLIDIFSNSEKAEALSMRNITDYVQIISEMGFEKGVNLYKFVFPDFQAHTEVGGLVILDTVTNQALIVSFPFCP